MDDSIRSDEEETSLSESTLEEEIGILEISVFNKQGVAWIEE